MLNSLADDDSPVSTAHRCKTIECPDCQALDLNVERYRYHNEADTGKAINSFLSGKANTSGLKREDIWYTSKLASNGTYDQARKSIKQSVQRSGLGYIDLFLLHSPYGGKKARLESWRAVEDAIDDGEVRAGGVSNFGMKQLVQPRECVEGTTDVWQHPRDYRLEAAHRACGQPDRGPSFQHARQHCRTVSEERHHG